MYVLINKNSYDLHQCAPFAVCFSDDKSKLEEEIKRTINIIEKFDKDIEEIKQLIKNVSKHEEN